MAQLEAPHVSVLTKVDLLHESIKVRSPWWTIALLTGKSLKGWRGGSCSVIAPLPQPLHMLLTDKLGLRAWLALTLTYLEGLYVETI